MVTLKKWTAFLLSAALAAVLSACTIPAPGFVDYDVSGYVQALLDSSYHDSHEALMEISGISEADAQKNSTTTVENAAVHFCNTYGISPSDDQLQELQVIMKQAFSLTKYTVKEERKVETGYYLEVEIASITNFEGRAADIEKLKTEAQNEAAGIGTRPAASSGNEDGGTGENEDEDSGDPNGEESSGESSSPPAPPVSSGEKADVNDLFVNKVLEFCKQELANISYDVDTRTVPLDILQTEKGELQLDLNQIEKIDQTVIRF